MSRFWPILVVLIVFLPGCGEDNPSSPEKELSACLTVTVDYPSIACPQAPQLTLDASCSSDPETSLDSLQVRWDFQNDGHWDTPFRPATWPGSFTAPVIGPRTWFASCEVRNLKGQTAQTTASADLGPRPVAPDLIVNGVWFNAADSFEEIDSIGVAQPFILSTGLLRCGQTGDPSITITYTRDGVIVDVREAVFDGPFDCEGWSEYGQHLDIPGRYTISFLLDAEDAVAESSEANNEATAVLWVLPRTGGPAAGTAR